MNYNDLVPGDVMRHEKFPWSDYLQRHITHPGVIVSQLHPIFGLRLAALFVELTAAGYASLTPGQGTYQILSGVRTRAHQTALWNADIRRHGRPSGYVANPDREHGRDAEGVMRAGSNHMPQRQDPRWGGPDGGPIEVGYAVDIRNQRGTSTEAWAPLHSRLDRYGIDWPLKGSPLERWHLEWFPRRASGPLDGKTAWPKRPGVHRPLYMGLIGDDVLKLQRQANQHLRSEAPEDGVFGSGTHALVSSLKESLNLSPNGFWTEKHQEAFEQWEPAAEPAPAPPPPPPNAPPPPDPLDVLKRDYEILKGQRDAQARTIEELEGKVEEERGRRRAMKAKLNEALDHHHALGRTIEETKSA